MGKNPMVAPYSGAMLPMVARSARLSEDAGAIKFDELADNALLAQHLRDGEDEVGGGGAFLQTTFQFESDHLRQEHRDRLAEHAGLGFDSADAPTDDAESVDHGGVRIGTHDGVGIGERWRLPRITKHHGGEIFEIYLVHDAGVGRHHAEVLKRFLAPAQEGIALLIALELEQRIDTERFVRTELVDLNGVIDHEIDRDQRIREL